MITELLAYLVNKGIRAVITTHSPYVVDHFNNLVRAGDLSEADQQEVAPQFKLGTANCFLRAADVAAYLFTGEDPVRVVDIFGRDDHLIDWDTFGRTSDYITNLYTTAILPRIERKT